MRKMLVLAMLSILLLIVAAPLPASAAGGPKGPRTRHTTTVRRTVRRTIRRTIRRTVRRTVKRSTRTSSQLGGKGVKLTTTKKSY